MCTWKRIPSIQVSLNSVKLRHCARTQDVKLEEKEVKLKNWKDQATRTFLKTQDLSMNQVFSENGVIGSIYDKSFIHGFDNDIFKKHHL